MMTAPIPQFPVLAFVLGPAVLGRVAAVPVRGTAIAEMGPAAREVVGAAAGAVGGDFLPQDRVRGAGAVAGLAAEAAVEGGGAAEWRSVG